MRHRVWHGLVVVSSALLIAGVTLAGNRLRATADSPTPVMIPGYQISLFASGTAAYTHPDSVTADTDPNYRYVYVGYQNVTAKDGSDNKTSTVVQYTPAGHPVRTYSVPGHCDGLRVDPTTHLVWGSFNEDANPVLSIIEPWSGKVTEYTFPPTPHGGGYDDIEFINGRAFIAASNPNLNSNNINLFPAVDAMQLVFGNSVYLTPVLMGNDTALDTTNKQTVTLNEIDPDSMTVDPQGDLVLDNQAGAELVFLHGAGSATQTVTRVPLGTQVDDTVWATSAQGRLLVADSPTNEIWSITASFTPGTVYTEAANDSGVASFLGTIDLGSGTITPIGVGFSSPTGLLFVPGS